MNSQSIYVISYILLTIFMFIIYKSCTCWIRKIEKEVEQLYQTKHQYREDMNNLHHEMIYIKKSMNKHIPRRRRINEKIKDPLVNQV